MTGHGFQNLVEDADQTALFDNARHHLAEGGCFVFETRNARVSPLAVSCDRRPFRRYQLPDGSPVDCFIEQDYDPDRYLLSYRIWRENRKTGDSWCGSGQLRFSEDGEIRERLARSGLAVSACFGDWDGSQAGEGSPELIYLCH